LECVASDPDFSDRPLGNVLKAKVWQLEQPWRQIYEPISEEAANKILAEIFPPERGSDFSNRWLLSLSPCFSGV
jgi:hypothetical protein